MHAVRHLCSPVLALCLTLGALGQAWAEPVAKATGPTQIEPGNLFVLSLAGQSRWIIMPHEGSEYFLFVATVGDDGSLDITSHKLPIDADPDDDPPDDETLADLVGRWADDVGDSESRQKLAAAYQASVALIDTGSITRISQLLQLQTLANTTVLGAAADDWRPFFESLSDYLDANTPADLAGYRAAWIQIAEGLR